MNQQIVKRDGRVVDFNREKIEKAILKAFIAVDGNTTEYAVEKANKIANYIESVNEETPLSVEQIQDLVEAGLMNTRRKDVARAYITYRNERTLERERNSNLIKTVKEKILARNVQNQNANVDEHSFGGRMGEANSAIMKQYALNYCLSAKAKYNHLNNRVYTHDLDHYPVGDHNCLSIPFDDLLVNGFNTRQTDVRPAQSVSTAFQLVAVIFQLQSLQQFGGVSATHLDWTMVPYVRKSFFKHFVEGMLWVVGTHDPESYHYFKKDVEGTINVTETSINDPVYTQYKDAHEYAYAKTVKEIYQAVEAMYHNLNTLQSRSGNQLPFTSINYGTCTLEEGRLISKAVIETSIKGIGKLHKTSIFPCNIFQCMKGVNRKPGDPNYDLFKLALKSTSLRLYPNYANVDWSGNAGYDINDPTTYFSTMGKWKMQLI